MNEFYIIRRNRFLHINAHSQIASSQDMTHYDFFWTCDDITSSYYYHPENQIICPDNLILCLLVSHSLSIEFANTFA